MKPDAQKPVYWCTNDGSEFGRRGHQRKHYVSIDLRTRYKFDDPERVGNPPKNKTKKKGVYLRGLF